MTALVVLDEKRKSTLYCFSTVYRITSRIERKENDEQGTPEYITFLREIERLLLIFIMK